MGWVRQDWLAFPWVCGSAPQLHSCSGIVSVSQTFCSVVASAGGVLTAKTVIVLIRELVRETSRLVYE